jgi:hypothetical protein
VSTLAVVACFQKETKPMVELWSTVSNQKELGLPITSYLQLSETVRACYAEMDLKIHPSSRFATYDRSLKRLFRAKLTSTTTDIETLRLVSRAFGELWQLAAIANYSRLNGASTAFSGKAKQTMQDAAMPAEEPSVSTPGRDTQFELFVGAAWAAVGVPCLMRDPPGPDFTLILDELEVGMEVKRIRSLGALPNRVRDANKQIAAVRNGGFVVTDLTALVTNNRLFLETSLARNPVADLERRLKDLMSSSLDAVRRRVSPSRTFGWLGYCQALYLSAQAPPSFAYQWKNFNLGLVNDSRWLALASALPRLVQAPAGWTSALAEPLR